jgi:hypothetical protein
MSIFPQQQPLCRHAQVIGMHHAMASAAATAAAHAAGKAVHIWTCNTLAMMHGALEARADALVTDVPHRVLQVRELRRSKHFPELRRTNPHPVHPMVHLPVVACPLFPPVRTDCACERTGSSGTADSQHAKVHAPAWVGMLHVQVIAQRQQHCESLADEL